MNIKKILASVELFFTKIFSKEYAFLKANSKIAVDVTNVLKSIVESPVADIIVSLTPPTWDNELLFKVRPIIEKVALETAILHELVGYSATNTEAISILISELKKLNKDARVGFWMEFSAKLSVALNDGKLSIAEAAILAQLVYTEVKK